MQVEPWRRHQPQVLQARQRGNSSMDSMQATVVMKMSSGSSSNNNSSNSNRTVRLAQGQRTASRGAEHQKL